MQNLISFIAIAVIGLGYVILRHKMVSLEILIPGSFSTADDQKRSTDEIIIKQKVRLKEIAFFTYLAALTISFLIGVYAIYLMINSQLSWDHFLKIVQVAAGASLTVGLRSLYRSVSDELSGIEKK